MTIRQRRDSSLTWSPAWSPLRALVWSLLISLGAGLMPVTGLAQGAGADAPWHFAVSGDSRNCGDVVMPAVAAGAKRDGAAFYWHLGDYRAIYDFDEDYRQLHPKANISQYESDAWPDFIEHQIKPFGTMPVYLSIGNHETIPPKTRTDYLIQFADWLLAPPLERQRLADDPADHVLRDYYHWIENGVDFITMDNGTDDEFDFAQLKWLHGVLDRAGRNSGVRSVVLGMHKALPDSISSGHSMNDSAQGTASGRSVYDELLAFEHSSGRRVYVVASHSHFFISNVYATTCRAKSNVLPGWIVGTAGAVRYRLPKDRMGADQAIADTYGYLHGTVAPDGTVDLEFKPVAETDVPQATVDEFTPAFVHRCFAENKSNNVPAGPVCETTPAGHSSDAPNR
jgi:hypothetical protein